MGKENVKIEISKELLERLEKQRDEFTKSIGIEYDIEKTIWEMFKVLNILREEKK